MQLVNNRLTTEDNVVEPTSTELLEHYRDGDERAADDLFTRYVERLTAMVRAQMTPSLRRRIDAEDPVHSAYRSFFVRARDGQFTLQRSGELWKLLVTITLNKLRRQIAHHRAHKRTLERDRAFDEFVDISGDPSPLEALVAADELAAFMAKLNPLQRQVLQLRLQESRWEDIAKTTRRSPRTVRRVLQEVQRIWSGASGVRLVPDAQRGKDPNALAARQARIDNAASNVATETTSTPLDYREYHLEKLVGSGGMGKVYRARQKSTGQLVAVKMLRKSRWTQPDAVQRFLDEARIVGLLRHPGIVAVHGVGQTPSGGPFIVMEFIEGENLATIVANGRPSAMEAAKWIAEVAAALDHAHRHGVVHCDLKPSNLLREHTGRLVITDFGLAATRSATGGFQMWGGTPAFMAPEQLDPAFGEISPVTDVFALGLVLFNLATGQPLVGKNPVLETIGAWRDGSAISRETLSAMDIPATLAEILEKCLAIEPKERFSSAAALADALRILC